LHTELSGAAKGEDSRRVTAPKPRDDVPLARQGKDDNGSFVLDTPDSVLSGRIIRIAFDVRVAL